MTDGQTLRWLLSPSPDTIQQHFDQLLDDIARPSRSTGKNRLGEQYSTLADFDLCGAKAIEVLEVQSSAIPDVDVANAEQHCDAAADVARLAQGVLRLFQAASEARQPGQEPIGVQWDEGFARVRTMIATCE